MGGGVGVGGGGLTCLANLPRMCKGYVNQCRCPSHSPTRSLVSAQPSQVSVFMCLSCVVVVVFSCGLSFTQSVNLLSVTH